jgi:outer membrane lipoprotein SlyB
MIVLSITGCANDPIVDRRGLDQAKYQSDLAECRTYAQEVSTVEEAAEKAAIGAAVGGAIGAIFGNSDIAGKAAGAGAVGGGTEGALDAEERKERILFRCLKGRGYRVLG